MIPLALKLICQMGKNVLSLLIFLYYIELKDYLIACLFHPNLFNNFNNIASLIVVPINIKFCLSIFKGNFIYSSRYFLHFPTFVNTINFYILTYKRNSIC